jgi:uncharacterized Fe-S cluster-containing radical SAM superfamily protein
VADQNVRGGVAACSMCGSSNATSYFRITKIAGGVEQPLTMTCSLKCMVSWAYRYAQMNGAMLAMKAKSALDQFIDGLKNLRG